MTFSSSMCFGKTSHRRFLPKQHHFSYGLVMPLLDLDEVSKLEELSYWLRVNRRGGLYSFHESDYLSAYLVEGETLKQRAIRLLKQRLGESFSGRVLLLSQWRFLGKVFNPITLFYFVDDNGQIKYLMSEVSNTPWNERHLYCLKVDGEQEFHQKTTPKDFHVSPYNPMDMNYVWRFSLTKAKTTLHLSLEHNNEKHFDARFNLKREALSKKSFQKAIRLKPLMSIHAVLGIYWEALKLLIKRIPIYDHSPKKNQESSKWQKQN